MANKQTINVGDKIYAILTVTVHMPGTQMSLTV